MAKRDIPEINAGSMADIAFLLLIFFLVTTTMDRDKAYLRDIPKKVEIKTPPRDVEVRNILLIKTNERDEIMVREEVMNNPDDISDRILEWYTFNEQNNDVTSNFPLYTKIGLDAIEENIRATQDEFDMVEKDGSGEEVDVMLDFIQSKIGQWERKKKVLKMLGKSTLSEIASDAHIRIETKKLTGYGVFTKIQSEIEEALFELRDAAANRIFNEGYASIISKVANEPENKEYEDKKLVLKTLYPAKIIEVTPN